MKVMMYLAKTFALTGAIFMTVQLVNAHWEQQLPAYAFCETLEATPAEERLEVCADQNTVGAIGFKCVASPYKDAHGKVAYTFHARLLGADSNTCTVEL